MSYDPKVSNIYFILVSSSEMFIFNVTYIFFVHKWFCNTKILLMIGLSQSLSFIS